MLRGLVLFFAGGLALLPSYGYKMTMLPKTVKGNPTACRIIAAATGRVWQDRRGKQDGTGIGSLQQQYGGKGKGGESRGWSTACSLVSLHAVYTPAKSFFG